MAAVEYYFDFDYYTYSWQFCPKSVGTQFNGLSVGPDYGDDCINATNYPIVRLTNKSTRHVFYARTNDHSTMGIAYGQHDGVYNDGYSS